MENSTEGNGNSTFVKHQTYFKNVLKSYHVLLTQKCGRDTGNGKEQKST